MEEVQVEVARFEERDVIAHLIQLYTHDFSELWSGSPLGELEDDGRFADYPLDIYWQSADHVPLLLRLGRYIVGFALLNATAHSGESVDRNMAEFFVARKHRRSGVGTAAAHAIFSRYPGRWETSIARRNVGALAFWRRAVAQRPRVENIEERDLSTAAWNGPVIRFRIRQSAA